jgi:hypothetical protein
LGFQAPVGQVVSYNASFWRLLKQDINKLVAFDTISTPKKTNIFDEIVRATKHLNLVIAYRMTIHRGKSAVVFKKSNIRRN